MTRNEQIHHKKQPINLNFKDVMLSPNGKAYTKEVSACLDSGITESIILFGSQITGEATSVSDVDLLIIVKDQVSDNYINYLDEKIIDIEVKYGYSQKKKGFINYLLNLVIKETGMFRSHFICRKCDLLNLNFNKIFNVNIIALLVTPKNSVMMGVIQNSITLYGEDLRERLINKIKHKKIEVIRSFFMNSIICLCALLLLPFSQKATKFCMLGVKWHLYTMYNWFYCHGNIQNYNLSHNNVVDEFRKFNILDNYLKDYMKLRQNYTQDVKFVLISPLFLVGITIKAFTKLRSSK